MVLVLIFCTRVEIWRTGSVCFLGYWFVKGKMNCVLLPLWVPCASSSDEQLNELHADYPDWNLNLSHNADHGQRYVAVGAWLLKHWLSYFSWDLGLLTCWWSYWPHNPYSREGGTGKPAHCRSYLDISPELVPWERNPTSVNTPAECRIKYLLLTLRPLLARRWKMCWLH